MLNDSAETLIGSHQLGMLTWRLWQLALQSDTTRTSTLLEEADNALRDQWQESLHVWWVFGLFGNLFIRVLSSISSIELPQDCHVY